VEIDNYLYFKVYILSVRQMTQALPTVVYVALFVGIVASCGLSILTVIIKELFFVFVGFVIVFLCLTVMVDNLEDKEKRQVIYDFDMLPQPREVTMDEVIM